MDITNSSFYTKEQIDRLISSTELCWPSLVKENEKIRELVKREDVLKAIDEYKIDVDAALISDCRSDYMYCGRCHFWLYLHKAGINRE